MKIPGCIQSLKCDTNECPTGIATHNRHFTRGLVVENKPSRVESFQRQTVDAAIALIAAMGLNEFSEPTRAHIMKRVAPQIIKSFEEIYPPAVRGTLLD